MGTNVRDQNGHQALSSSDITHEAMVLRAEKWLTSKNCKVVIRDPFRARPEEQPDAIGWRDGVSILIEVKVSRPDFHADKRKSFRQNPAYGMGDWRFYMSPPGVIRIEELPVGWGLLYATEKTLSEIHGVPPNTRWGQPPFMGEKRNETMLLVSALRRLSIRGYLPEIY